MYIYMYVCLITRERPTVCWVAPDERNLLKARQLQVSLWETRQGLASKGPTRERELEAMQDVRAAIFWVNSLKSHNKSTLDTRQINIHSRWSHAAS
jgi:hypothetical protein